MADKEMYQASLKLSLQKSVFNPESFAVLEFFAL